MNAGLREVLEALARDGQLDTVEDQIDARYVSPLVARSPHAVLFRNLRGYRYPLVSGLLSDRRRLALCLGMEGAQTVSRLRQAIDRPIPPVVVPTSPVKEVVLRGDEVDLAALPIPVMADLDGGPFIASAVTIASHPELGRNAGIYRMMYRNRNTLGIDIVTPNNLRAMYEETSARGEPLPVSIAVGAAPIEMLAATFKAPMEVDELGVAGGLREEAVELVPGETIPVEGLANAEMILEGELLPGGHVHPEGQYGEFSRLMGGVHLNPLIRVKAMTLRRDAIFYALQMPWENIWLGAPVYEARPGASCARPGAHDGRERDARRLLSLARRRGDPQGARRRQERPHRAALGGRLQARHRDRRRHRRLRPGRGRVGRRHARPGRQGRADHQRRSRQATRSLPPAEPAARRDREAGHRRHHPRRGAARALHAHHLPLPGPRRRRTATAPRRVPTAGHVADADGAAAALRAALADGPLYFAEILRRLPHVEYPALVEALGQMDERGEVALDKQGRLRLGAGSA